VTRVPLVLIEWEDSFNGNHGWFDLDDMPEEVRPVVFETVGFEVQRHPKRTTLAMSYRAPDGEERMEQALDLMTIPAGCIRKRKVLRPATRTK
jgi:hypothetical protein